MIKHSYLLQLLGCLILSLQYLILEDRKKNYKRDCLCSVADTSHTLHTTLVFMFNKLSVFIWTCIQTQLMTASLIPQPLLVVLQTQGWTPQVDRQTYNQMYVQASSICVLQSSCILSFGHREMRRNVKNIWPHHKSMLHLNLETIKPWEWEHVKCNAIKLG